MTGWVTVVVLSIPQSYSHGNPSDAEQQVLEMINRARRDPVAEGLRLGIDITEGLTAAEAGYVKARPPLALNAELNAAALAHAQDMWTRDYFEHASPDPTPSTPRSRMEAAGYAFTGSWSSGENIATGSAHSAAQLEDLLMIDAGIAGRGHRKALLDIAAPSASRPFREVGLAYRDMGSSKSNVFRYVLVQDFAKSADSPSPFLLGVVYDDTGNAFYDPGEGMAGVAVALSAGTWSATTSGSGGYAVPVSGTAGAAVNVTASGGGLAGPVTKSFLLTGENVKVDFWKADGVDTDADGLPDHWEARYPGSADPASDVDADGATALSEFRFGSDPTNAASTPQNPGGTPAPAPAPPPADDDDGGGGGCGALGIEVLLALLLLRRGLS